MLTIEGGFGGVPGVRFRRPDLLARLKFPRPPDLSKEIFPDVWLGLNSLQSPYVKAGATVDTLET
jgi:hypothetical protein